MIAPARGTFREETSSPSSGIPKDQRERTQFQLFVAQAAFGFGYRAGPGYRQGCPQRHAPGRRRQRALPNPKSIFILRVIDEPMLRMPIEKVLSGIEHVHAFTRAVSVGNPREFLQAEKEDQEMAEACKRLIKNCIICWNYLYLSQKLAEIDDPAKREELLQVMAHGSAAAWGI